jgi:hypothetical protein
MFVLGGGFLASLMTLAHLRFDAFVPVCVVCLFVCLLQAAKAENKRLHTEQRLLHRQVCQPARPPSLARATSAL